MSFEILIEESRMLMWKLSNLTSNIVSDFEVETGYAWDGLVHVLKVHVDGHVLEIENACYGDLNRYINCRSFIVKLINESKEVKLDNKIVEENHEIKNLINHCIMKINRVKEHVDNVIEFSKTLTSSEITLFTQGNFAKKILDLLTSKRSEVIELDKRIKELEEKLNREVEKKKQLEAELEEFRKYKEKIEKIMKIFENVDELKKIINEFRKRLENKSFIKAIGGNQIANKLSKLITTLEETIKQLM